MTAKLTDTDRQSPAAEAGSPLAPDWLNRAAKLLADHASVVPPLEDNREDLPEFIYRH